LKAKEGYFAFEKNTLVLKVVCSSVTMLLWWKISDSWKNGFT